MNSQKQKINFYLDKNIWSDIADMSESELKDFKKLIKPLKEQLKIGIYYSPVGVLELIKGMKIEKHYQKCQDEIRIVDRITNKHILEDPWNHVRRTAGRFVHLPDSKFDLRFLDLCRDIAILPYREMQPRIRPIRDLLNKWIKEWADELNSLKLDFRRKFGFEKRNKKLVSQSKQFWEKELTLKRKQRLWIAFCDHYSLSPELRDLSLAFAYDNFHSFRYWVHYRLTYENKMLFDNKRAESGDYFDWQRVVYLNIMDYLVTEDNKFRTILKESDNPEIHTVAITFNEFLSFLRGVLRLKRAPDSTSEEWYDAHPI